MKRKIVLFAWLAFVLILGACSPSTAISPTGEPPTPTGPPTPTETATFNPPAVTATSEEGTGGGSLIAVEDVQVQVGVGSPIPVDVMISGTWPGLCSQLSRVDQRLEGTHFEITLQASPTRADCPADQLGLPFRFALPLNMVEVPAGTYSVSVNGIETAIAWDIVNDAPALRPTATGELQPILVDHVQVQVGVGSPIPVEVFVSGTWPGLCSQLSRIDQQINGKAIEISLLATPQDPQCRPDNLGLPFRIAIPLNMAEMELGAYTVRVNDFETAFDWDGQPGGGNQETGTVAFVGQDGNIWVLEAGQAGSAPRQITQDAVKSDPASPQASDTVLYHSPKFSTGGRLLAYRRDAGSPVASGIDYMFSLWVTDLETGESRQVLEHAPAGFAWKPGSHLLTYAQGVAEGYFTGQGVNSDLANGIWQVDLDQAELAPVELVRPERGFTLSGPTWSPDGRFLAFEEVHLYEGRGMFAYYDFEGQAYVPWEEAIGGFSWSPDGERIAFDLLTYVPTGEERIYIRERLATEQSMLSEDYEQGYAFQPVFNPQGDAIAYLAELGAPESRQYTLLVQPVSGSQAQNLGVFQDVRGLSWTADGLSLVFSAGPYDQQQVYQVSIIDGTATVLAQGSDPAVPAN